MLTIYRRHLKGCHQTSVTYRRCKCPIHVRGTVNGQRIKRQSLDLVNWEKAQEKVRRWEALGQVDRESLSNLPSPSGSLTRTEFPAQVQRTQLTTIDYAVQRYFQDLEDRRLAYSTIRKDRIIIERQLSAFCQSRGLRYLEELDVEQIADLRSSWKNSGNTCSKKLDRVRTFFRFCRSRKWVAENPAEGISAPSFRDRPTLPFSKGEMDSILAACDTFPSSHRKTGGQNAKRLRAFVLLLRYSGLRIGDALRLTDDPAPIKVGSRLIIPPHIIAHRIFLYTQKTGTNVYVPLPPEFFEALNDVEKLSQRYYFWSGNGKMDTRIGNFERTLKSLFARAGIVSGHAHRFRDTFAVELLIKGVPMDAVSILLGHSSIKITEKHYAPWVKARQEQLEQHVMKTWDSPKEQLTKFPTVRATAKS
jgi:integrase